MADNNVSLVLSDRAAYLLDSAIRIAINEKYHFAPESDMLTSIQEEIRNQMPKKDKAKKKRKKG